MELKLTDEYKVSHSMIDEEHQLIVGILNEYNDILSSSDRNFDHLVLLFEKIKEYTVNHFRDEEQLMDSFPYTGVEDHKIIHDTMLKNIDHFLKLYKADPIAFDHHQYLIFLQKWLTYHILFQDSKLILELNKFNRFSMYKNIIKFIKKIFKGKE